MSSKLDVRLVIPTKENTKMLSKLLNVNIYDKDDKLDAGGLYSQEIFGTLGTPERNAKFAYIELNVPIIHPFVYNTITRLSSHIKGMLLGKQYGIWDNEKKNFDRATIDDGETGITYVMKYLKELVFEYNDSRKRTTLINDFNKFRENGDLTFKRYLVLPAGLRDVSTDDNGRVIENEINDMYRKILQASKMFENLSLSYDQMRLMDQARLRLQLSANEVHDYILSLAKGKHKLINGKFVKVNIEGGTGNVLTSVHPTINKLDFNNNETDFNRTIIGVHQYCAATFPFTSHHLGRLLGPLLQDGGNMLLFDSDGYKQVSIKLPQKILDKWTTTDGIRSLVNKLFDDDFKNTPVMVGNGYPFIIRGKGNKLDLLRANIAFKMEDGFSYEPITYGQLFYIIARMTSNDMVGMVTRYPVTGQGSTYLSKFSLHTTVEYQKVEMYIDGVVYNYNTWNKPKSTWLGSVSVHYSRLKGLGGDYDGDKVYVTMFYEQDSINEIKKYMNSKEFFITPDGKPTLELESSVISNITQQIIVGSKKVLGDSK